MPKTGPSIDEHNLTGLTAAALQQQIAPQNTMSRRRFIVLTGMSGLAIGVAAYARADSAGAAPSESVAVNQYVQIDPAGKITLVTPHPEVGQGVRTSLPMILAEELGADWNDVTVKSAEIDVVRYGLQYAGGSRSVRMRFPELRKMGAMARHMLVAAAAAKLNAPAEEFLTENSRVVHKPSGTRLTFAALAESASKQTPPADEDIVYKDPGDYVLLGKRVTSVDNERIVRGESLFGIDTVVPDMLYATYVKCPSIGGRPRSANLDDIKAMPGVVDAFVVEGSEGVPVFDAVSYFVSPGIAIVAQSTWQALKARQSLNVEWDESAASKDDSDEIAALAQAASELPDSDIVAEQGDVDAALEASASVVESYYTCAFASHAQLEPENCVARVTNDLVEVWAPTQTPTATVVGLMKVFGFAPLDADPQTVLGMAVRSGKVKVHQIRGGGGFGRRLENDYAREAAVIARRVGKPVKLQWTREDDMACDFYRPPLFTRFKGGLSEAGDLLAWEMRHVSVSADEKTPNRDAQPPANFIAKLTTPNVRVRNPKVKSQTPVGPMRAPQSNTFAFAEQSFIHELAVAAGRDHVEFLIDMLGERRWTEDGNADALNTGRAIDVIRKVADNAGWRRAMPEGRGLGLGFYFSHAGHIAEIAEVSVDASKFVRVHKVWVAADIGPVINLSGAEGQAQGSVIDAISTMADQKITLKNGAVQETNYHDYPLLRIEARPEIDVDFIQTDNPPTGMGEPALPPLAAAVCNAIFAATGERIRSLPISAAGFYI